MSESGQTDGTQTMSQEEFDAFQQQLEGGLKLDESPQEAEQDQLVEEEPKEDTVESDEDETPKPNDEEPSPDIKENKRLREKNRELYAEIDQLRQEMTQLSQKMTENKQSSPKNELADWTDEKLEEAELSLDEKMVQARIDGDTDLVSQIREAKRKVRSELKSRLSNVSQQSVRQSKAEQQFETVKSEVLELIPEIQDPRSELVKQVNAFKSKNPELMAQLGGTGEVMAVALSLIKQKQSTSSTEKPKGNLEDDMKSIFRKSTTKKVGQGQTSQPKSSHNIPKNREQFDEMWDRMKGGELSTSLLG